MTTYILISGAWHAGWCWERLVPELESRGHRAIAPDLIGMGREPMPPGIGSLDSWADQVAELVRAQPDPVVLVGHSRGGIVISEVAERVPERISTLVYLAAFLIPSGATLLATASSMPREDGAIAMIMRDDGTSVVDPAAVGPIFYNTTPENWVARAAAQLSPEPMAVFTTPLRLTDAGFGSVARCYIECTQDRALPLALQRAMQRTLPCDPVFTLDTDHSPFFSAPTALADCLVQVS